jgi:putative spermidine/putrescine transport system permease protein
VIFRIEDGDMTGAKAVVDRDGDRRGAHQRGWIWLRLAVVAVYAFILLPIVMIVWVSFFSNEIIAFPPDGYTLAWYANIFRQATFVRGFATSFEVALVAMASGLVAGALASVALVRLRFVGRDVLANLLLAPLIVPGIVAGTAIYIFYIQIDLALGLELAGTLPGLVLAHIAITIPWTVRLISASLVGIDPAVEEAARNLGATAMTTFWRVTLPLIRPGLIAAALFGFITSFGNLEMTLFLVGPGRTTLPIAILQYLTFNLDPTIAAVSVVQIVIIGTAIMITDRFVNLSRVV